MISRKSCFGIAFILSMTSSCATTGHGPSYSLYECLQALPSIATASEFMKKFGEPLYREDFDRSDSSSGDFMNGRPRSFWKSLVVQIPSDLTDTLPTGSTMLVYGFTSEEYLNPTSSTLYVCLDKDERIIGWMYIKSLEGEEKKARVRH